MTSFYFKLKDYLYIFQFNYKKNTNNKNLVKGITIPLLF